jgi:acyl carrier protein
MNRDEIREWLMDWLSDKVGISPDEVEMDRTFASYGLHADDFAELTSAIEEAFEERLEAEAVRPRSTVAALTRYLCELTGADDEDGAQGEEGGREIDMDELARDIGLQ